MGKLVLYCIASMFCLSIHAQIDRELERINFFPTTPRYLIINYQYQYYSIDTPSNNTQVKGERDLSNLFALTFAHKLRERFFLGINGFWEAASEKGLRYGLPSRDRIVSQGARDPELFLRWRIRPQTEEIGLFDLVINYAHSLGPRRIGDHEANRLNGQSKYEVILHHGKHEGDWEYRTSLKYVYFNKGILENTVNNKTYDLHSNRHFLFNFQVQNQVMENLFVNGSIGFRYRGTQGIKGRNDVVLDVQSGTGSIFGLGMKSYLTNNLLGDLRYTYSKNDYFVKGSASNLEGQEKAQAIALGLIFGF